MDHAQLLSLLSRVTGLLVPGSDATEGELRQARKSLAAALVGGQIVDVFADAPAQPVGPLPDELPDAIREELDQLVSAMLAGGGQPGLRVFRRELPVPIAGTPDSVPLWADAWGPEKSLGPFIDVDGRRVWFDLRIERPQVSIVNATTNARLGTIPHAGLVPASDTVTLAAGSLWWSARQFDPASPVGTYLGLRILGGTVGFSAIPTIAGDTIKVQPGSTILIDLTLDPAAAGVPVPGQPGGDARSARAEPPRQVQFAVTVGGGGSLSASADAEAEAYGETIRFRSLPGAPPKYDAVLRRLIFPFETGANRFDIAHVESLLFRPSGRARIASAGWAPPVATPIGLTMAPLGVADGSGAMVLGLDEGLTARWPLVTGTARVALGPALIAIETARLTVALSQVRATGRFDLDQWATTEDARSRLELSVRPSFVLQYDAKADGLDGGEVLRVDGVRCSANVDRPVPADGRRLPFRSDAATATIGRDRAGLSLVVSATATPPIDPVTGLAMPFEPLAFALTNAYLRVTHAEHLRAHGTLTSTGAMTHGVLTCAMPLSLLLPTLPDPYAANVTIPRLPDRTVRAPGFALHRAVADPSRYYAMATAAWRTPAQPSVRFALKIQGGSFDGIELPLPALDAPRDGSTFDYRGPLTDRDRPLVGTVEQRAVESLGRRPEELRLLDLSSRVDQFGVGVGVPPRSPERRQPVLSLRGMDLLATGRSMTVFTQPSFQWEPVYNIPNPDIVETFPPSAYSDTDGGPTRLAVPTATLVPVAPDPAVAAFLHEFHRETDPQPLAARLTLPFGIVAVTELNPRPRPFPFFDLVGPGFDENRPRFAPKDLEGGLQLTLRAAVRTLDPEGPSPSMPGLALQINNAHERGNHAPAALTNVLGDEVSTIFNGDFGPAAPSPHVPVSRIDLSGYGASIFSDWRYPNVPIPGITQARFDAIVGRTMHEVVQAKSLLYPWGVIVVRTITMQRIGSGGVFRRDSGWQAASDGDYRLRADCIVHPGVALRLVNVRRIRETSVRFERSYPTPPSPVVLTQVLFDADMLVENATLGASANGLVTMRDLVGYVQIRPDNDLLSREQLADLIQSVGPIGGPIDCELNVAGSGVHMRLTRIEVDRTASAGSNPQFVAVARGAVELPDVGQWSVAKRTGSEPEPHRLDAGSAVPLIRDRTGGAYRFSEPSDLHRPATPETEYGWLQSTGAQRMLVPRPHLLAGDATIYGGSPMLFADMYSLAGGVAYFPRPEFAHPMPANTVLRVTGRRRVKLEIPPQPGLASGQFAVVMPERTLAQGSTLRVRSRFAPGALVEYKVDSSVQPPWSCRVGPVAFVGDFDMLEDMMQVRGSIVSSATAAPRVVDQQVEFGGVLSPVQAIINLLTSFGLPLPFDMAITNTKYAFKSVLNLSFPLGKLVDQIVDLALKSGPGLMIEIELKLGFGKEAETPGNTFFVGGIAPRYDLFLTQPGQWHFFLEIESTVQTRMLTIGVADFLLGGGAKIKIAGKTSDSKTAITVYWSVAGSLLVKLPPLAELKGTRTMSMVSKYTMGANQLDLGVADEREGELKLLAGFASVKLTVEILLMTDRQDDHIGLKGQATVGVDVTYCWLATKSFEVEFDVDEKIMAAYFVATTILPMGRTV